MIKATIDNGEQRACGQTNVSLQATQLGSENLSGGVVADAGVVVPGWGLPVQRDSEQVPRRQPALA